MPSAPMVILLAILGLALAAQSVAFVRLWRRLRAPSAVTPPADPATGRLIVLERRCLGLEDRLARWEASSNVPPHPSGPRVRRRFDRGGTTLISVPNLAASPSPAREAASGMGRRFGDVWALADSGAPIEAVAKETGYPIGQVELILGLRRRAVAGEGGADA